VLFVLAFVSVLALLVTSDFSEPYATNVSQIAPGSDEVRLVCVFVSAKQAADGWALVLRDAQGQQVRGYVSSDVVGALPSPGAIVEVVADLSWEDGLFLFVREVSPVRV
jgi:predicted butyrate kinase (DUF1464 family)